MKRKMTAVVFHGPRDIKLETVDAPQIQNASDAIIRVTVSTICGSDIHLINGITVVEPGTHIGHELVGVIEQVGDDVSRFKLGDRVAVPTFIHCGHCYYCTHDSQSQCENGGILGFGPTFGGMGGAQAEYCRVPFADVNLQSIPDSLTDEDVLFVGDILSTAYFGLEKGMVRTGDTVAVVGPGPVGLCVEVLAPIFGASKVIMIGTRESRLEVAASLGALTMNPKNENVKEEVLALTEGRGADVVVECVGTAEALNTSFDCVRKGGNVSLMGVFGERLEFPLNELCLTNHNIFTGLVNCDHLAEIIKLIDTGRVKTSFLITHRMKFADVLDAYHIFENKLENVLKIALTL